MKTKKHGLKMKPRARKGIFLYKFATPSNSHGSGSVDFSTREKFTYETWAWLVSEAKVIVDRNHGVDSTVVGQGIVWMEG